eukprot:SAG31_NODE_9916_length_1210_cov_12.571557_1_plen_22_part_10
MSVLQLFIFNNHGIFKMYYKIY